MQRRWPSVFRAIAVANTSRDSSSPEGYSAVKAAGWCKGNRSKLAQTKKGSWSFFLSPVSVSIVSYHSRKSKAFQTRFDNLMAFDGFPKKWVESHFNPKTSMLCCRGNLHSPPVDTGKSYGDPSSLDRFSGWIHPPWVKTPWPLSGCPGTHCSALRRFCPLLPTDLDRGPGVLGRFATSKTTAVIKTPKRGERDSYFKWLFGVYIIFRYPLVN